MSALGYDAGTLGNHDFDKGTMGLAQQLHHATFPLLNANYDLENTPLANRISPYRIFEKGRILVGIFGIGIDLQGLVDTEQIPNLVYKDPVQAAIHTSQHLRKKEKCDLIVCLSHLGFRYEDSKISDILLAGSEADIDIILGGHTHTFMDAPYIVKNKSGKNVMILHSGFGGIRMGKVDIAFELKSRKIRHYSSTVKISKKSS
jgi:5'-nucleotidase